MKRWGIALAALAVFGMTACGNRNDETAPIPAVATGASGGSTTGSEGRIVFERYDPAIDGPVTYTVDPDGSDLRRLFSDGQSEMARWSPDGTLIQIFCCDDGMAAHLVDPKGGEMQTTLSPPDPTIETLCGGAWSPDGERLACEGYGGDHQRSNGIYSIRVSDGGGLTRITSNQGGEDIPGDYSPDGTRMVFFRVDANDDAGLFVTNLDGTGLFEISGRLKDISPDDVSGGNWSPTGEQILFAARRSDAHHKTIWIVNADGSSLHELRIDPACGGLWSDPDAIGCYSPAWSPDGRQIVYVRSTPKETTLVSTSRTPTGAVRSG